MERRNIFVAYVLAVLIAVSMLPATALSDGDYFAGATEYSPLAPFSATSKAALCIEPMSVMNLATPPLPGSIGEGWAFSQNTLTLLDGASITVTTGGANADGLRVVIAADATVNLTLLNAVLTTPGDNLSPLYVLPGANLILNLEGENYLTGSGIGPGLAVNSGRTLTIQGSGTLTATGGAYIGENGAGAGIGGFGGGNAGSAAGTITIGGDATVIATGGQGRHRNSGAGIGGGGGGGTGTASHGGAGGNITITDNANVTAIADGMGAAIGGGGAGVVAWLTAVGGHGGYGGTITIGGNATVTAIADRTGAAIGGGGAWAHLRPGASGTIRFEGTATIRAYHGTHNGSAIGPGTNDHGAVGERTPEYRGANTTITSHEPAIYCDECGFRPCRCCPVDGSYPCECPDCPHCNDAGCVECSAGECGNFPCRCCDICGESPCECPTPRLIVATASALPREIATVQVRLQNNPGFAAMLMRLSFSDYLTLTGYTLGRPGLPADALSGFSGPIPGNDDSYMGWLMRGADIGLNDLLLTLYFSVSTSAALDAFLPVEIAFESFVDGPEPPSNAALEEIDFDIINGGVRVRSFRFGDANGDGRVTSLDSTFLARYLIGGSGLTICYHAMDLNADGDVTMDDLTLHAIWLVGRGLPPVLQGD